MAKKIYCASITPTLSTDMEGNYNEWQLGEASEAEYGESWDGDVKGYILNAAEDEEEMEEMANADYNGTIHSLPDGAIVLTKDGRPIEAWWAEEGREKC